MKELQELVRPNIWRLEPYSCARDEYKGKTARVFLDANENPYNNPYNRYPDPLQLDLKAKLSKIKGVPVENIFLGNGSDEAIDLVYRVFCRPQIDNVVAIAPTYGMYQVSADINDVLYRSVLLNEDFSLNADRLLAACDRHTKVVWLCSPNNPTGNALQREEIIKVLTHFEGIVVLDEAYIDFSSEPTFRSELKQYPNIIVLNTMSKAWGCAGIRLGMAFASTDIINLFKQAQYPYIVSLLTQMLAGEMLGEPMEVVRWVKLLNQERERMMKSFAELPSCEKVFPTDANFFLARMTDANAIYRYLIEDGIIVLNRSRVKLCNDCLRITIGTKSENNYLLGAMRQFKVTEKK